MSHARLDPAPLAKALDRTRISVLVALAVFAIVLATRDASDSAALDRGTTLAALGLALGSIAARHMSAGRSRPPRSAIACAIAGMLLALAVGALGLAAGFVQGARETGILLAFGGFILATPRPRIAALATPRGD